MAREQFAGLILAGGRGTRIGGAKALAPLAGRPLIAHVARVFVGADMLAVAGDEAAAGSVSAICLTDPPGAARGPLAGVMAGLEWAESAGMTWLCCAPCDAPLLPDDLMTRLRAVVGENALACVQTEAGIEPLISLWHTSLAGRVREAIAESAHPPMRDLVRAFGAAHVRLDADQVLNVNTREDLARAEALLAR